MLVSTNSSPRDVLCSTNELEQLTSRWQKENRARVFAQNHAAEPPVHLGIDQKYVAPQQYVTPPTPSPFAHTQISASALASLKRVVESRLDLPSDVVRTEAVHISSPTDCIRSVSSTEHTHASVMSAIETKIIMSVCDQLMRKYPAYCTGWIAPENTVNGCKDLIAHSCCAYVTPGDSKTTRRIYLPIAPPTREQITRCGANEWYNKNVQTNVASILSAEHLPVIFSSIDVNEPGAVNINSTRPIEALGTTQCCEELLFGKNRTTNSDGFYVCKDIGITYAQAVHKYQQYGNVSIGDNITLVPTFHRRTPLVVSMRCPQLNLSQLVTCVSVEHNHVKFGPDHTARVVEVLNKLAPFVKQCCETYMKIPREIIDDIIEDDDMPVATCKSIEHCFAHNNVHGVSAYIAKHVFSLPTAILNSHAVRSGGNLFPMEQDITVYVAALFGGAVTDPSQISIQG